MKLNLKIREMTMIAMATALMAIFSQISIPVPFTTVPITLQVFAVILIATILECKLATISIVIYILLGGIGVPVFANFSAGLNKLVGATGGYIWGFLLMAIIIGKLSEKNNKKLLFVAGYLGLAIDYILGTLQLKFVLGLSIKQAIMAGVTPFIVKDIIVVFIAITVAIVVKKNLKISNKFYVEA